MGPEQDAPTSLFLLISMRSSTLPVKTRQRCGAACSQDGVQILIAQHFVCEPVEDVEDEKAEGEERARDGVDPFGAVDKPAADLEQRVVWRKRGEYGRCLGEGTISRQVDVQTETGQEEILVVLS